MSTSSIISALQEYHLLRVNSLATAPSLRQNLPTSELPCAICRLGDATHSAQSTQSGVTNRAFDVLVYVAPEGQINDMEEIEEQTLLLLDEFIYTYFNHRGVLPNIWIEDVFSDSGVIILEHNDISYIGFILSINLVISNQEVSFIGD